MFNLYFLLTIEENEAWRLKWDGGERIEDGIERRKGKGSNEEQKTEGESTHLNDLADFEVIFFA